MDFDDLSAANVVLNMYSVPVTDLPSRVHSYIVFRIVESDFQNGCFGKSFADLNPKSSPKILMASLAAGFNRMHFGTKHITDGIFDTCYFAPNSPRWTQIIEEVKDEAGERTLELRVWCFIHDPKFDIAQNFDCLMKSNMRYFAKKKHLKKSAAPPCKQLCEPADLRILFASQLGSDSKLGSRTGKMSILDTASPLNPVNVLNAENAFACVSPRADQAQRLVENYFNVPGDTIETFCGPFPVPQRTYRINPAFFTPDVLESAPLPNVVSNSIAGHRQRVEELDKNYEKARVQIAEAERDGDETERMRLQEHLEKMNQEKRRHEIELNLMARKVTEMEKSSDHASLLCQSAIEQVLNNRNDFRKLYEKNSIEMMQIESSHIKGTDAYYAEIKQFRSRALREMWNTFNTSDNITDACKHARSWYEGLPPGDRWFENFQFVKNLSPYGNMIARIYSEFGAAFTLESNFALTTLMLFTMLASYRYDWDLRPNMLITGEGAVGKSFIFDIMETIAAPGLFATVSHVTKQAYSSDQDMSDVFSVNHEMDTFQLGVDHNGNDVHADSLLKDRLTKQRIITISPVKNSETRKTVTSICRAMQGMAGALNEKIPSVHKPIMQRFFPYQVRKRKRWDTEEGELCFLPPYMKDEHLRQIVAGRFRLQMFYLFVIEKAIEAGAMPDVDTGTTGMVSQWVFAEMAKRGVPFPQKRYLTMYEKLARVATIYYAIEMEYFSELGIPSREHPSGEPREFDPVEHLEGIIKWLYVTQEISVHILTLMENVWVPNMRAEVAGSLGHIVPHTNDADGRWQAAFDGECQTPFRLLKKFVPRTGDATGSGKMDMDFETDYRYVSVTGLNLYSIAEKIRDSMTDKPSADDIASVLSQMTHEYVKSSPKIFTGIGLEDDTSVAKESIRAAEIDDDPHGNGRRLSVAIDVIQATYSGTLKHCVEVALQHARQMPATYITGFSYSEEGINAEGQLETRTFYNIADVVECKRGTKVKAITNNFSMSLFDVYALTNRVNPRFKIDIAPIKRVSTVVLDKHLDLVHFTANCIRNGIDPDTARVAYPPWTKNAIQVVREEDPRFSEKMEDCGNMAINDMVLDDYPRSFARNVTEKKEASNKAIDLIDQMEVSDLDSMPTTGEGSITSYVDVLDVAGHNKEGPKQLGQNFIEAQFKRDEMELSVAGKIQSLSITPTPAPARDVSSQPMIAAEYTVGNFPR